MVHQLKSKHNSSFLRLVSAPRWQASPRRSARGPLRRPAVDVAGSRLSVGGNGRVRTQKGEEVRDAGARQNRRTVPGLRRHRAAGDLRRLHPAVLPDLPDRRQTARRPGAVAAAEVGASSVLAD